MHRTLVMLLAALVLLPAAAAGRSPATPDNELQLGLGWSQALESGVFNVPDDVEGGSALGFEFAYYKNLSAAVAVGVHFFGYSATLEDIQLLGAGGEELAVDFDLTTYDLGARLRWTFLRGVVSPYAYAGVGWVTGEVEGAGVGSLQHDGFGISGGCGAALFASPYIGFAIEALLSTGWSNWDTPPFLNSDSDDFDPGMFGILGAIVLRF